MDFHEGYAFVSLPDKIKYGNKTVDSCTWGLIDTSGKTFNTKKPLDISKLQQPFSDNISVISSSNKNLYIVDIKGNVTQIQTDYAYVTVGKYNSKLDLMSYFTYEDYNYGKSMRQSGGYINATGKMVIDFSKYKDFDLSDFNENIASVKFTGEDDKEYYAYIDASGNFIYEPQRKYVCCPFNEGFALVV